MIYKNFFSILSLLLSTQTICMEIGNECFLLPEAIGVIASYLPCKQVGAFKQACTYFNNNSSFCTIQPYLIEAEDKNVITRGLIHFSHANDKKTCIHFFHNNHPKERIISLELMGYDSGNSSDSIMDAYKGIIKTKDFSYNTLLTDPICLFIVCHSSNPNQADADKNMLLNVAITKKNISAIELLLANPAIDVNQHDFADETQRTPLYNALFYELDDTIVSLLNNPNTDVNKGDIHGHTPLIYTCFIGDGAMCTLLLNHKDINPQKPDNEEHTPLWYAVSKGHAHIVELLRNYQSKQ